jgi:TM2 domain-containing membrane protein YozV
VTTETGKPAALTEISPHSRLTVTLLAWFLGILGVHRFYLGKIGTGIAMLLTGGGAGIWFLVDFIIVATGSMKDKEGRLIKHWNPQNPDITALPLATGILSIVGGALSLIFGIVAVATAHIAQVYGLIGAGAGGIPSIIFGIIAIIGGTFALQRRNWVMSLVGSVFALLSCPPAGVPAIIFVAVSQKEFNQK